MLHILVGTNTDDYVALLEAAKTRGPFEWVVPKSAVSGDPVLFLVRAVGLLPEARSLDRPYQALSENVRYSTRT